MFKCKLFFFFIYKCWIASSQDLDPTTTDGTGLAGASLYSSPHPKLLTTLKATVVPLETINSGEDLTTTIVPKIEELEETTTTTQDPRSVIRGLIFEEGRGLPSKEENPIPDLPVIRINVINGIREDTENEIGRSADWTFVGGSENNLLTAGEDFTSANYLRLECATLGNGSFWTHDGLEVTPYSQQNMTTGILLVNASGSQGEQHQKFKVSLLLGAGKGVKEKDSGNFSCVRADDHGKASSVYIYVPEEQKEISQCELSPCGLNTICEVRHGNRSCNCLKGYVGNPDMSCRLECSLNSDCVEGSVCIKSKCVDNCIGACGANSYCHEGLDNVPVCTCLNGFEGDPYEGCIPQTLGFKFERKDELDLCSYCGVNADCISTANSSLVCRCKRNLKGDPYSECRRQEPSNAVRVTPCGVSPCGENTYCQEKYGRAICHCQENFHGDPWTKCHAECLRRDHCPDTQNCIRFKCQDVCDEGVCGKGAECTAENHRPSCSCPNGLSGDPHKECS